MMGIKASDYIFHLPGITYEAIYFTVCMGRWRDAEALGIELYDITLKSGERAFAPSPKLLSDIKKGKIKDSEYAERFKQEMRESFSKNRDVWLKLLNRDKPIALACYCGDGFCHRHLIIEILHSFFKKKMLPFAYGGEIKGIPK